MSFYKTAYQAAKSTTKLHLPRLNGLIGYSTNNSAITFILLNSLPINKTIKDFSGIKDLEFNMKTSSLNDPLFAEIMKQRNLNTSDCMKSPCSKNRKEHTRAEEIDVNGRVNESFNPEDSNLLFINGFPSSVNEALMLEAKMGGPKLFVDFTCDKSDPATKTLHVCCKCGSMKPRQVESTSNDLIDLSTDKKCQEKNCEFTEVKNDTKADQKEIGNLKDFYDRRGLLLDFKISERETILPELLEGLLKKIKN